MPSLNIKFQTHLTVTLSENVLYPDESPCKLEKHAENCSSKYFCLSGLLNSLSNKVIQIKVYFITPY